MNTSFTVPLESAGLRLDKFLVSQLPDFSRHFLQLAIKNGQVKVDGKAVAIHYFLKSGQIINIENLNKPKTSPITPSQTIKLEIIKETPEYIIINKPSGLTVHPAPGVNEPTLVENLLSNYPEIKQVGEDINRPGIVHRLDKDVSGLMVVARTQESFNHLKSSFQNRKILKKYLALVIGHIAKPSGTIDFSLARSRTKHGLMAARQKTDPTARTALTMFEVLKQYQQTALLLLTIATGRTHQIRAHLNAFGHPIVGDKLYRPDKISFKANPGRIFLHAHILGFYDLNNSWQEFISPLPAELNKFLENLK